MAKKPPTSPRRDRDMSRFGWSSMNQIKPLHADGQPLDAEELAQLRDYKAHQAALRGDDAEPEPAEH